MSRHARVRERILDALHKQIMQDAALNERKTALWYGVARLLNATNHHRATLHQCLSLIIKTIEAERGMVAWFDDTTHDIVVEESHKYEKNLHGHRMPLIADTLLSIVYNTGRTLHITSHTFERKFESAPYSRPTMVATPLMVQGKTYGALVCADKHGRKEFTADDVLLMSAVSPLIAFLLTSLHQHELRKETEHLKKKYILPFQKV